MTDYSIGCLGHTSKMPCPSWSLSAFDCITTDPICNEICYARHNHYKTKVVDDARRRNKLLWYKKDWVNEFVNLLKVLDLKHFRWFDSGDLEDIILLEKICEIADKSDEVKFWLPTRRDDLLTAYWEANGRIKLKELHKNLSIRISGKAVDENPDYVLADKLGVNVASVKTKNYTCIADANAERAKAKGLKGKAVKPNCGSCRSCWNNTVKEISYPLLKPWNASRKTMRGT